MKNEGGKMRILFSGEMFLHSGHDFANAEGEIVHAELPEEADTQTAHFH